MRGMEDIFHQTLSVFDSFTIMGIDFLLFKNEWLFIHFSRGGRMNLVSKLEETAKAKPDRIAYIFGEQTETYGDCKEKIDCFAGGLRELGVEKGDHVALPPAIRRILSFRFSER